MDTAIVVFTRDLRLHDNPALYQYVRRYVPELAGLDPAHIHTPSKLPSRERPGYPRPSVELS